jgi:hypothetical protein
MFLFEAPQITIALIFFEAVCLKYRMSLLDDAPIGIRIIYK